MTFPIALAPSITELKKGNIVEWMQSIRTLYNPIEQARWNQANIDSLFVAGEQRFINTYYQFYPVQNFQNFQFNLIQQPINMVTGYQRQHRKNISYTPVENTNNEYADDLTTLETYSNTLRRRLEKFSVSCELSAVSGMNLIQPYLDYRGDDPLNGTLDLKIWPYNSFFIDPFFRDTLYFSDCNFIWTQQYLTKQMALSYFPNEKSTIMNMSGMNTTNFSFYFLPENYNSVRNQFLILSHIWYQSSRMKKMLYNRNDGLIYDFYDDEKYIKEAAEATGIFDVVSYEVPTWNVAIVLNNETVYNGRNPLKFDRCPFALNYWNYDPHIAQPDLRNRSLTRPMRDVQFLMNRRIILNHDISESSINSGFQRKEGAVVNETDLKYAGNGKDIIIAHDAEMDDCRKIIPNAVPPSDLQLANELADLIFRVSGVNQELLGMPTDTDTGIETMLKQSAGIVTLQKYFDQWDTCLKIVGEIDREIMQYNWSPSKVARITGKPANLEWQTKIFSKYSVVVEEGMNTSVQQQTEFLQILKLNELTGGIIPPKFIIEKSLIHGKKDVIEAIEQAQEQQQAIAHQQAMLQHAELEAKIQELQSRSVSNIGLAREREGRKDSNLGLYEERISNIAKNHALSVSEKINAIKTLVETLSLAGQAQATLSMQTVDQMEEESAQEGEIAKEDVQKISDANKFMDDLIASLMQKSGVGQPEETPENQAEKIMP